MRIHVLGTEYEVRFKTKEEHPLLKEFDGFCDKTTKNITVREVSQEGHPDDFENFEKHQKQVLRHEIIRAFLIESGLDQNSSMFEGPWATNEEMIDWFAIQSPKVFKVFEELGI